MGGKGETLPCSIIPEQGGPSPLDLSIVASLQPLSFVLGTTRVLGVAHAKVVMVEELLRDLKSFSGNALGRDFQGLPDRPRRLCYPALTSFQEHSCGLNYHPFLALVEAVQPSLRGCIRDICTVACLGEERTGKSESDRSNPPRQLSVVQLGVPEPHSWPKVSGTDQSGQNLKLISSCGSVK